MSIRIRAAYLLAFLLLSGCLSPGVVRHQEDRVEFGPATSPDARSIPLLVYEPDGYEDPARAGESWPLVIFLHGILAEGTEPSYVTRDGLPRAIEQGFSPPCLVAAPQLWTFAQKWTADTVARVLARLEATHRVDPDRVILMGLSSGAATGWNVVKQRPDLFAGVVPVAGWTTAGGVSHMTGVPVWAVFGSLDFTAPAFAAARGVRAHHALGGETRMTVLKGVSHWMPRHLWQWPEMWAWILDQRRGVTRPARTPRSSSRAP